jgi:hypothetical protein
LTEQRDHFVRARERETGVVKKNVSFPGERILAAAATGGPLIEAAGFVAEAPQVAFAVERHRWAWRPETVRVLLVAESHVYTSSADLAIRVRPELLPQVARHAPKEYVRLVYCLGYGETWLLTGRPEVNGGTWQFGNIFGRLAETGRQPTTVQATRAQRLAWKVDTLLRLRARGVWLVDSSLHGVYAPGAKRVTPDLTCALHELWWTNYGKWLFEQTKAAYRCVIGKVTPERLARIGVPWDGWIYQPQAERSVPPEQFDHGWRELLTATACWSVEVGRRERASCAAAAAHAAASK